MQMEVKFLRSPNEGDLRFLDFKKDEINNKKNPNARAHTTSILNGN